MDFSTFFRSAKHLLLCFYLTMVIVILVEWLVPEPHKPSIKILYPGRENKLILQTVEISLSPNLLSFCLTCCS